MDELKSSAAAFGTIFPGSISGVMDTFRHDSWQLLLSNPVFAFRAALFLRCSLMMKSSAGIRFDTRIAIGLGPVDFISANRVSDSRGLAFTLSGRGLDGMKKAHLAFDRSFEEPDGWHDVSFGVVRCSTAWLPTGLLSNQERCRRLFLGKHRQKRLIICSQKQDAAPTRQAIGDSLSRAHWGTVHDVLSRLEKKIAGSLPAGFKQV